MQHGLRDGFAGLLGRCSFWCVHMYGGVQITAESAELSELETCAWAPWIGHGRRPYGKDP